MTRDEGVRRLKRLFGSRAMWREHDQRSSPEQRQEIRERIAAIRAERQAIEEAVTRRLQELDWYREAQAQQTQLYRELKTLSPMPYYRISVGHRDEILGAFHVIAEGDNWAEAIASVEKKQAAKAS